MNDSETKYILDKNIALLIDAENISSKYIGLIIDEANKYGKLNFRRIYGDWTSQHLQSWRNKCIEYGLTPIQQFTNVSGKNASDFSLVIDAMDILNGEKVDSFCLVSSDSDFTKLVTRLKEDNMFVFGMGESKTPISLVNSCETFSYLDKMYFVNEQNIVESKNKRKKALKSSNEESSITPIEEIIKGLNSIIDENSDEDGWAYWGNIADLFKKKYPGFHPRNYGTNIKPLNFLKKLNKYDFKKNHTSIYLKIKS